jgi:molybdenum cofactor cytidylyltransferase
MGQPKQLLPLASGPLIAQVLAQAIATSCSPIGIVLGAHSNTIRPILEMLHPTALPEKKLQLIPNPHWPEGQSSSIQAGLAAFSPLDLSAILFTVCDQPGLSTAHLTALITQYHSTGASVVASQYAGILGTPMLCDRRVFPLLRQIKGDRGVRQILPQLSPQEIASVPFPAGEADLDTPEDYQRYCQRYLMSNPPLHRGRPGISNPRRACNVAGRAGELEP